MLPAAASMVVVVLVEDTAVRMGLSGEEEAGVHRVTVVRKAEAEEVGEEVEVEGVAAAVILTLAVVLIAHLPIHIATTTMKIHRLLMLGLPRCVQLTRNKSPAQRDAHDPLPSHRHS